MLHGKPRGVEIVLVAVGVSLGQVVGRTASTRWASLACAESVAAITAVLAVSRWYTHHDHQLAAAMRVALQRTAAPEYRDVNVGTTRLLASQA